jgi:hypothetical protein
MRLVHRLRLFRDERGIALALALGIMTVLAISGTTLITYVVSNEHGAQRSGATLNTSTLTEAGINNALSIIFNPAKNPLNQYLFCNAGESLPCAAKTTTYSNGTVTWTATLNLNASPNPVWTITSTGSMRNPSAPKAGNLKRTQTVTVQVVPVYTVSRPIDTWNYVYVYGTGDPSGCDYSQSNNSSMGSPLYVAGNACFYNSAKITGGALNIWGKLTFNSNQNSVGTSSSYITTGVHIKGGCKPNGGSGYDSPCTTADNVYANPAADTSPITLSTPQPDWNDWYLNASPGPYYGCTTSSGTVPTFDNNQGSLNNPDVTKLDRSVNPTGTTGAFDLTPASGNYTCKTPNGEISFAQPANGQPATLTVNGTVFIDGNARVDYGSVVKYTGMGTLFLSGSFVLTGTNLCAVVSGTNCDWVLGSGHWDPNSAFLNIIAGYKGGGGQNETADANTSIEMKSAGFQGGMQAANKIDVGTSSTTMGPLVARSLNIVQSITTYPFPLINTSPVGSPNNGQAPTYSTPQTPTNYSG